MKKPRFQNQDSKISNSPRLWLRNLFLSLGSGTLVFSCVVLLFSSCAYRMGPHARRLPGGYQKIFVKIFENRTQEVGVEADLTNAFIQELARSGVAVVTTADNADVTLEGVIHTVSYLGKNALQIYVSPTETRSLNTEYQTHVNVVMKLVDRQKKEVWQGQILGEKNYKAPQLGNLGLSTANPIYNQNARRQVFRLIAKDMATEAIGDMTENF